MRLERTYYHQLSAKTIGRLKQLTLYGSYGDSMMRDTLNELAEGARQSREVPFVLAWEDNKIVGWGLLTPQEFTRKRVMMIYVMKPYRRRGIGSAIAKKLRRFQDHSCFPWDETSYEFYDALKINPYWNGRKYR